MFSRLAQAKTFDAEPSEMQAAARFGPLPLQFETESSHPFGDIKSSAQGWGELHLGWSVNHRVLQLKGHTFRSGFGSHANAAIEYSLPTDSAKLTGVCGIDDTVEARQAMHAVAFSIELDGKEVWKSEPVTALSDPSSFDINTTGGKTITLRATGGENLTYTPVDFVGLHLTRNDGTVGELAIRKDFNAKPGPLVTFKYDGHPSADFLSQWKLETANLPDTENYTAQQFTRTDPTTGLQCRTLIKRYKHYPVVEWSVNFKNTASKDSPMLEEIRSMDLSFASADRFLLHHHTGDYAAADSYEPHLTDLAAGTKLHFAPHGGRPTDAAWPYFNLENVDDASGVIVVVGWPGQWSADFVRSSDDPKSLRISAGQETTHFILHPGEEARTPISVLMFYKGDSVRGQNLWRRWMLAENVPHPGKKLPEFVNAASLGLHQSEKSETDGIALFAKNGAGLNYWWMDAGWYPCNQWWDGVGSWYPDPERFPHGVKTVSDFAHKHGSKLILWMEPERVHPGTWLNQNHPEWLLGKNGSDKLLDLGNPSAQQWAVNHIDDVIVNQGVDLYRQDFNEEPLPFWREHDSPDRQGITEMRHIEGYLALWDELHKRHPNLLIDTCASGGRRLDLETLRRSVPLWRSDDSENPEHNQCQTYGLASWVPMFGTGTGCNTPYTVRSDILPFFTLGMPADPKQAMDWDLYRRESANWKKIREDQLGDYYPLLPYSRDMQSWIAWQFDRPESDSGVVQAFRRPSSPFETATFPLHALDAASKYTVTNLDSPTDSIIMTGEQLTRDGIQVRMEQAPAAVILSYKKTNN